MRSILFLAVSFLFIQCSNNSNTALSSADSLVIQFKSTESGTVTKTVSTTDSKAVNKLAYFTSGKEGGESSCRNDGHLLFYANGKLVSNVSFNYTDANCRYFTWREEGVKSTEMSNEAADFLKGLAEGKSWY